MKEVIFIMICIVLNFNLVAQQDKKCFLSVDVETGLLLSDEYILTEQEILASKKILESQYKTILYEQYRDTKILKTLKFAADAPTIFSPGKGMVGAVFTEAYKQTSELLFKKAEENIRNYYSEEINNKLGQFFQEADKDQVLDYFIKGTVYEKELSQDPNYSRRLNSEFAIYFGNVTDEIMDNVKILDQQFEDMSKAQNKLIEDLAIVDNASLEALKRLNSVENRVNIIDRSLLVMDKKIDLNAINDLGEKIERLEKGEFDVLFQNDIEKRNAHTKDLKSIKLRQDVSKNANNIKDWSTVGSELSQTLGWDPKIAEAFNKTAAFGGIVEALASNNYPGAILGTLGMFKRNKPADSQETILLKQCLIAIDSLEKKMTINFDKIHLKLDTINNNITSSRIEILKKMDVIIGNQRYLATTITDMKNIIEAGSELNFLRYPRTISTFLERSKRIGFIETLNSSQDVKQFARDFHTHDGIVNLNFIDLSKILKYPTRLMDEGQVSNEMNGRLNNNHDYYELLKQKTSFILNKLDKLNINLPCPEMNHISAINSLNHSNEQIFITKETMNRYLGFNLLYPQKIIQLIEYIDKSLPVLELGNLAMSHLTIDDLLTTVNYNTIKFNRENISDLIDSLDILTDVSILQQAITSGYIIVGNLNLLADTDLNNLITTNIDNDRIYLVENLINYNLHNRNFTIEKGKEITVTNTSYKCILKNNTSSYSFNYKHGKNSLVTWEIPISAINISHRDRKLALPSSYYQLFQAKKTLKNIKFQLEFLKFREENTDPVINKFINHSIKNFKS